MFCNKCGTEVPDGAVFCQKCGAKLTSAARPETEPSADYGRRSGVVSPDLPMKKSHGKLAIIFAVAALAVLAVIFIAINRGSMVDYEASVRAHTPFADSRGLPYTYGEVFDKYISDAKWDIRESGDVAYVDISGKAKGTDEEIYIALKAAPYEQDSDLLLISTESVTVGGSKSTTEDEAVRLISDIFMAYDEGANDLSGFTQRLTAEKAETQENVDPTETPAEADTDDAYGGYGGADNDDWDDFTFEDFGEPYDIIEEYIQVDPYLVKLNSSYVPIYKSPDIDAEETGAITDCGTYTIVEEFHYNNGFADLWWGRLKSGAGWIFLDVG